MKLLEIKKITGTVELLSGLHIGAGKDEIEIGGVDMPVIKDSVSGEPYIPGSSLKGKMRSLLEWKLGELDSNGQIKQKPNENDVVARIFGNTNKELKKGPTRIIVRDALLNREQQKTLAMEAISRTEVKYENTINRLISEANPRQQERAISGLLFDLEIVYKIFDISDNGENDKKNFEFLKQALKLVELDALGGGWSRGNGKVKFNLSIDGQTLDLSNIKV